MTRQMASTGFLATLMIIVVLTTAIILEPTRQATATRHLAAESIAAATDHYAANCATCHGAAGEGIGAMPGLASEGVRGTDVADLHNVIARGRYNTSMPAWSTDEGGILTNAQINQIVTLIQLGDWSQVGTRVADLGLSPPTAAAAEVSEALLLEISTLPDGEMLARSVTLYAENCAACHGANLEGTGLAPSLTTPDLLYQPDGDIIRTVEQGVPTTLMAGWSNVLTRDQIGELIALMKRWEGVQSEGIALPVIEEAPIASTPEMIAEGKRLFGVACTACHGVDGLGSPMAPALNNRTFLAETHDGAIKQIIAGGVSGTMMPAWGGRLDDTELNALVAYLRSLESSAPVMSRLDN